MLDDRLDAARAQYQSLEPEEVPAPPVPGRVAGRRLLLAAAALAIGGPVALLVGQRDAPERIDAGHGADTTVTTAPPVSHGPDTTTSQAPPVAPGGTTATTVAPPPTTGGVGEVPDPLPEADQDPKVSEATVYEVARLVDVRVGHHAGFDRITFEFDRGEPGYLVRYIDPPAIADGSGEPVEVAGDALLQVMLQPASGADAAPPVPPTIAGTGAAGIIEEVVRTGDFESYLTWVVGLSQRGDFRVTTMSDPTRLVVDVRNEQLDGS